MMGDGMQMSGPMWIGAALWGLLLVSLIALATAGTIRLLSGRSTDSSSPRDELDRRYARGEIDRDVYLELRADLASDR